MADDSKTGTLTFQRVPTAGQTTRVRVRSNPEGDLMEIALSLDRYVVIEVV
jgi:hypothetical protein